MLVTLSFCNSQFSQELEGSQNINIITERPPLIENNLDENISILKKEPIDVVKTGSQLYFFESFSQKKTEFYRNPDIVSTFRSNIRFGGFWDRYTIINFTPELNLKPADFINLYAIHNLSYFVPVDKIKQNLRSMVYRGTALMIIDYSEKLLNKSRDILASVLSFAAKVVIIEVINSFEKKNDELNHLQHFDYQFYSISVRF